MTCENCGAKVDQLWKAEGTDGHSEMLCDECVGNE